jgi:acyl-CoA thioesterase FadM
MFVVSGMQVSYRAPARLDDELLATARLLAVGGASMRIAQAVRRGETALMEAQVNLACVAPSTLAPRRIPKDMLATLRAALQPTGA